MFQSELQSKLKQIFGFSKVTFNHPAMSGEAFEQDTLFVDVTESRCKVTKNRINAKVSGVLTIFSQSDKLPFGFFSKRIEKAAAQLKKDLFFHELDVQNLSSHARIQNISELRGRFTFLYTQQYDPNKGKLTEFDIEGHFQPDQNTLLDIGDGTLLDTGEGILRV